jgi:hypothetical protein
MTDLIKPLTDQKAQIEAEMQKLHSQIWDLKVKSKSIDKAIKALQEKPKEVVK